MVSTRQRNYSSPDRLLVPAPALALSQPQMAASQHRLSPLILNPTVPKDEEEEEDEEVGLSKVRNQPLFPKMPPSCLCFVVRSWMSSNLRHF
jgi:hypothetical protein